MTTILGIDPGSHNTGFGVIQAEGDRIVHLDHGVIRASASEGFNARLNHIAAEVQKLFLRFSPQVTVIERIFLGRNADSAFKLGHIRGICLWAASQGNSEIVEYAARSVKKGITGSGAATKEQVQIVLFASLGIRQKAKLDASDALALAYVHARQMEVESAFERNFARRRPSSSIDSEQR